MHAYATAYACMRMHTSSPCFSAKSVLRIKTSDVSVTSPLHLPGTLQAPTEVQWTMLEAKDVRNISWGAYNTST